MTLDFFERPAVTAAATLAPVAVQTQGWPTEPVSPVVPFAGPADVVARAAPDGDTFVQQETARHAPVIRAAGQLAD